MCCCDRECSIHGFHACQPMRMTCHSMNLDGSKKKMPKPSEASRWADFANSKATLDHRFHGAST